MVNRAGRVDLTELSARFGVSEDTLRRDLRELGAAGLIRRVRGGALARSPAPAAFADRLTRDVSAKSAIAARAITNLERGMVIGIDGGTTALEFARALPPDLECTVVTNSLPVASACAERTTIQVTLLGGQVTPTSQCTVGARAYRELLRIRMDLVVVCPCGVDTDQGLTANAAQEAELKRGLLECGHRALILATDEKLGVVEPFGFGSLRSNHTVITNAESDHPTVSALEHNGISLTLTSH